MRHVLNGSALYQLPLGRGQKVNFGGNRLADAILGGWGWAGPERSHRSARQCSDATQQCGLLQSNTGNYTTNPVASGGHAVTTAVINIPGGGQSRGLQRPDVVAGVDPTCTLRPVFG